MATITTRKRADGEESYLVAWVVGGGRPGPGRIRGAETFTSRPHAEAFALDVANAENQWPKGWVKGVGYVDHSADTTSLHEVANAYFEFQEKRVLRNKIDAATLKGYRNIYGIHLEDFFGKISFTQVLHEDIEDWIDAQVENGASPKSVHNRHGVLTSIMSYGQARLRLRGDNPCVISELPRDDKWAKRQIRFLNRQEARIFRQGLKQDVRLLFDVMLATGLRWQEVSALRMGDFAFTDDGTVQIHIQRAWKKTVPTDAFTPDPSQGETRTWKLGLPKNRRTRWVVIADPGLTQELKETLDGMDDDEYVFTTRRGLPWRYEDFHLDRWKAGQAHAIERGITKRVTPHMLRHTCVVWSIANGIDLALISEMLGHSSITITMNVYGGLLDIRDPKMAMAMAKEMADLREADLPENVTLLKRALG